MNNYEYVLSRFTHDRVYSPIDFSEMNNPPMVHCLLADLAQRGQIVRVKRGVYCKRGSRFDPRFRKEGVF